MKDNLSIVILMIIFVMLIVFFPLYNYFERQDDMSYNLVLRETTTFVDKVLSNGYISNDTYQEFLDSLANTGNLYDVQLEAHKRIITSDTQNNAKGYKDYIEQYEIDYNDDILSIDPTKNNANLTNKQIKGGIYTLEVGDQFYVKLKNSSTTMAGAIFNSIISTSGTERIVVNYGGIVKNNSWKKVDANYFTDISKPIIKNYMNEATGKSYETLQSAINEIHQDNNIIKVTNSNVEESSSASFNVGKTIILNLSENNITFNNGGITIDSGSLTVRGDNGGKITVKNGTGILVNNNSNLIVERKLRNKFRKRNGN